MPGPHAARVLHRPHVHRRARTALDPRGCVPPLLGDEDTAPLERRPPPNNWHLSANRVPIPLVPVSGRARREEIERRRLLLPDDLYYDDRYAPDSVVTPPIQSYTN